MFYIYKTPKVTRADVEQVLRHEYRQASPSISLSAVARKYKGIITLIDFRPNHGCRVNLITRECSPVGV